MGQSSLPATSEGLLCILLVNTALSISVFKALIHSILDLIGLPPFFWSSVMDLNQPQSQASEHEMGPSYMDLFRSQTRTLRFDVLCSYRDESSNTCGSGREHDCSVCLTEFVPESEISMLSCNHVFHWTCLEKWLVYWNVTCPLCRSPFLPEEEEEEKQQEEES